jgi:hypothetical protein
MSMLPLLLSIYIVALDLGPLVVVSIISFELSPMGIFPTQTLAELVWGVFLDFSVILGGFLEFS